MILSLAPGYFGSALWSIFWEPDIPCNFTGAWVGPTSDVLRTPFDDDHNISYATTLEAGRAAVGLGGRVVLVWQTWLMGGRKYRR